MHMTKKHREGPVKQFNCYDCSFQANDQEELRTHLKVAQHKTSSHAEVSDDANYLFCHSCSKKCASREDLMKHRKKDHPEIIKKCKFYRQGYCEYNDICWFSHDSLEKVNNRQATSEFKCRFCETTFHDKSDFMYHRKTKHSQIVSKCRDFSQRTCNYSDSECWYKHDEAIFVNVSENEAHNSDFQKATEDNHPPDMMQRMMNLMEILMEKVKNLEICSPMHQ